MDQGRLTLFPARSKAPLMPAGYKPMEAALQAVEGLRGFPFGLDEALAAVGDITALRSHRRHRVMTIGGLVAPQAGEGG
jgi:hypothetical protein